MAATEREALYTCPRCGATCRLTIAAGTVGVGLRLRKRPPLCFDCKCSMVLTSLIPIVRAGVGR
jgi:hypothetical protein